MSSVEKDRAVEDFRNADGPRILISTEAGGEGRNFQSCHVLVNYDLPWNPMKVEQRIGRVDRIGQDHTVSICNLWVKDTVEERVLDVLERRIRVFEETVGGLDPILGDTETDIRKIMRLAGEKRDESLEEFGRQLEDQVRSAQDPEEKLGDFIMDTKSYRRELAERIAGQPPPIKSYDLDVFISQLLSDARTYIRQTGTRRIPSSDELAPCAGWLFTYQFNVPGVRATEHLEPVFVTDDGRADTTIGHSLVKRAFHFDDDEREIEASEIPDNLEAIAPIANRIADDKRAELQEQVEKQSVTRIERELSRLGEWFDYRERVARDRVEATRATLNRIRERGDESQRLILPVWEANLGRDTELLNNLAPERSRRLADVEKHRFPQISWALKALGRIEVVDLEPTDGPDAGLELREDFFAELQASLEAIGDGGSAHSAEEVVQRLSLT